MSELKKKRERGANFSADEVSTLLSIISDHKEIIECKKSDGTTWRKKEAAWDTVADSFNLCYANPRSKKALRKKYEDIKKNIRKKHKQIKMEQLKTGGGIPDSKAFTIMEKAVIAIAGCTRDGNTSVWDSDSIPKSSIIKEKPTNEANDESETMETDNQESVENFEDFEYLRSDVDKVILEKDKVNSTEDIVHKGISALKRLIEPNIRPMKKIKVVPNNEQEYLCETEREKELHNMQMSIFRQEMEINSTRLQAAQLDIKIKLIQKQVEETCLSMLRKVLGTTGHEPGIDENFVNTGEELNIKNVHNVGGDINVCRSFFNIFTRLPTLKMELGTVIEKQQWSKEEAFLYSLYLHTHLH